MMKIHTTGKHLKQDYAANELVSYLKDNETKLNLENAELYYDFPLYKGYEGEVVISKVLLVSINHGIIAFSTSNVSSRQNVIEELEKTENNLDEVFNFLYSRLIRNKNLRKTKLQLKFSMNAMLFVPSIDDLPNNLSIETKILFNYKQLDNYLAQLNNEEMATNVFAELIATIDGAKGLSRPKPRNIADDDHDSMGHLINNLETELASFDQRQKHGYMTILEGLQRIRGLAGSGKTVVLAMKAALMHLRNPKATILYTYHTKNLQQHIKRLITRFYRQFDDQDPNWSNLIIKHAWGVYADVCAMHEVEPISFSQALQKNRNQPFAFVCNHLINNTHLKPIYDYTLVDEGQDFSAPFLKLCVEITLKNRVVYAYDDLQTIFQVSAPTPSEILGTDEHNKPITDLSEDIILHKCYRNPREILVCAHALGFGIYGTQIVQMLENKEHWEDIGYEVEQGQFIEGSSISIKRPVENSLTTISDAQDMDEIIQTKVYKRYEDEIQGVAENIKQDIQDGLRPDDILVVAVDDPNAKNYLNNLAEVLTKFNIKSNNIHADSYGLRDFYREDRVTLSTIHKAKGNEAFVVYVTGVDYLFSSYAGPRERNILFTALTRAKAWVRVSGIGEGALACQKEINTALQNFPYLKFKYPSQKQLKIMKRDLTQKAIRKQKAERMLDLALEDMHPEAAIRFIKQKSIEKNYQQTTV